MRHLMTSTFPRPGSRSPWAGLIRAIVVLLVLCLGEVRAGNEEPRPMQEATALVDALQAAIDVVKTFDVQVKARWEWFLDEKPGKDGKPTFVPVTEPYERKALSRQMYSKGWRRIEKMDPETGEVLQIMGADLNVMRFHFKKEHTGRISRAGGDATQIGTDYQELFRSLVGDFDIPKMLRERLELGRVWREGPGDRLVVFEVPPTRKPGVSFGAWGYRVFADTGNQFLPCVIETFEIREGVTALRTRRTIKERKSIAPGVSVPTKAVIDAFVLDRRPEFFQKKYSQLEVTVDVARSRWNEPIPEEVFRVPFPAGLSVHDEIRDVAFIVGKADPGRNLDDLAGNARGIIRNVRPQLSRPSNAWVWWLVGGMGVGLAGLAGLYYWRRRMPGTLSS